MVLFVFDPVGGVIADALGAQPQGADQWARLRGALGAAVEFMLSSIPHLVTADVRVAAALECLWIVLHRWRADVEEDPQALLDVALGAFSRPGDGHA